MKSANLPQRWAGMVSRFWEMWHLSSKANFDSGRFHVITPWFSLQIGWKAYECWTNRRWSGAVISYGHAPGWVCKDGDMMFRHTDNSLRWYSEGWWYEWAPGLPPRIFQKFWA